MANYWAIAIGINQYQFLQPLMYAQWDAYCLQQCLQNEAQFPPEQCWLLTDTSAPINGRNSRPTRENIQHHIVQLCQERLSSDDVLWVFFSGYGVHDNGRDYLVPSDGDPTQPIATGIPASELFATLKTANTNNIIMLLDMKQFGGAVGSNTQLGHHTLLLAQENNLAVMLACQPGQFSHETLALRQGLFTAVLLEGIQQYGCVTLEHLAQYMGDRLPQLSEQHWRPRQDPAIVVPSELRYQLMLPGKGIPVEQAPGSQPPVIPGPIAEPIYPSPPTSTPAPVGLEPPRPSTPSNLPSQAPNQPLSPVPNPNLSPQEVEDENFWRTLVKWGGLLVAILLVGVVARNWRVFQGDTNPAIPNNDQASEDVSITIVPSEPSGLASPDLGSNSANTTTSLTFGEADLDASSQASEFPLEAAQQAIAAGLPLNALQQLDQVPEAEQTEQYANLRAEAERLNNQVAQTNRAILNEALASLNRDREETTVNQASDFHRALTQANRIQPGQPVYTEAQQYVQRWSQIILDLAEARAQTGSYADAVAAAQLLPPDQAELYSIAEQHIANWQQNVVQTSVNQGVIQQARAIIQPGQASSYNEAIAQLRSIQTTQPDYEVVRAQINQWSKEILAIAYQRADTGDLYAAINAAALVPDDAEVSLEAREAVEGWRLRVRGN
ncbi:MAG: caspase family protein [Cyanobacteria bacterium P01_E01_bin.6]